MTTYSLMRISRPSFSNSTLAQAGQQEREKSGRFQQQQALELIEKCYDVVPPVLSQLQQRYPQAKFIYSKSKAEAREELQRGNNQLTCSWRLVQDTVVLRVVLKVDGRNEALSGSLVCCFGLSEEACDVDADKLAATLMRLVAVHGGWTPPSNQVPFHPYAG